MKTLTFIVLSLMVGFSAQASGKKQKQQGAISDLADLIKTCRNFEADVQIKPFSTDIVCRGYKVFWRPTGQRGITLDTQYVVQAEMSMKGDRYKVGEYSANLPSEASPANCNLYEEVRQDIPAVSTRISSCDELDALATKGRDQFCNERLGAAPTGKDVTLTATGRTFDSCTGLKP